MTRKVGFETGRSIFRAIRTLADVAAPEFGLFDR
jgi:hypothetical protein